MTQIVVTVPALQHPAPWQIRVEHAQIETVAQRQLLMFGHALVRASEVLSSPSLAPPAAEPNGRLAHPVLRRCPVEPADLVVIPAHDFRVLNGAALLLAEPLQRRERP